MKRLGASAEAAKGARATGFVPLLACLPSPRPLCPGVLWRVRAVTYQAHFAARSETEILRRRILHEVLFIDEYLAGKRHGTRARFRRAGVVDRGQFLEVVLGQIRDDDANGLEHGEPPERADVQIRTDRM